MKTSSAKAKGRKLQQYVRDKILENFPDLTADDVRSTSMGAGGEDLQLSQAARKALAYTVWECKSKAAYAVYKDFEQAKTHTNRPGDFPVLVIKQNNSTPLAVIDLEDFLWLLKEAA